MGLTNYSQTVTDAKILEMTVQLSYYVILGDNQERSLQGVADEVVRKNAGEGTAFSKSFPDLVGKLSKDYVINQLRLSELVTIEGEPGNERCYIPEGKTFRI